MLFFSSVAQVCGLSSLHEPSSLRKMCFLAFWAKYTCIIWTLPLWWAFLQMQMEEGFFLIQFFPHFILLFIWMNNSIWLCKITKDVVVEGFKNSYVNKIWNYENIFLKIISLCCFKLQWAHHSTQEKMNIPWHYVTGLAKSDHRHADLGQVIEDQKWRHVPKDYLGGTPVEKGRGAYRPLDLDHMGTQHL